MKKSSFDLAAMMADFAAKGGEVKKIDTGVSAYADEKAAKAAFRAASGYEPEVVKNIIFECLLQGDDGSEFMVIIKAKNLTEAQNKIAESYPESVILSIDFEGTRDYDLYSWANNAPDF